jgi:hypothetical protein
MMYLPGLVQVCGSRSMKTGGREVSETNGPKAAAHVGSLRKVKNPLAGENRQVSSLKSDRSRSRADAKVAFGGLRLWPSAVVLNWQTRPIKRA